MGIGMDDEGFQGMGSGRDNGNGFLAISRKHTHLTRYIDHFYYLGTETCF